MDIYVITVDFYWKLFRHHGVSIVRQQIKNLLFCVEVLSCEL